MSSITSNTEVPLTSPTTPISIIPATQISTSPVSSPPTKKLRTKNRHITAAKHTTDRSLIVTPLETIHCAYLHLSRTYLTLFSTIGLSASPPNTILTTLRTLRVTATRLLNEPALYAPLRADEKVYSDWYYVNPTPTGLELQHDIAELVHNLKPILKHYEALVARQLRHKARKVSAVGERRGVGPVSVKAEMMEVPWLGERMGIDVIEWNQQQKVNVNEDDKDGGQVLGGKKRVYTEAEVWGWVKTRKTGVVYESSGIMEAIRKEEGRLRPPVIQSKIHSQKKEPFPRSVPEVTLADNHDAEARIRAIFKGKLMNQNQSVEWLTPTSRRVIGKGVGMGIGMGKVVHLAKRGTMSRIQPGGPVKRRADRRI